MRTTVHTLVLFDTLEISNNTIPEKSYYRKQVMLKEKSLCRYKTIALDLERQFSQQHIPLAEDLNAVFSTKQVPHNGL